MDRYAYAQCRAAAVTALALAVCLWQWTVGPRQVLIAGHAQSWDCSNEGDGPCDCPEGEVCKARYEESPVFGGKNDVYFSCVPAGGEFDTCGWDPVEGGSSDSGQFLCGEASDDPLYCECDEVCKVEEIRQCPTPPPTPPPTLAAARAGAGSSGSCQVIGHRYSCAPPPEEPEAQCPITHSPCPSADFLCCLLYVEECKSQVINCETRYWCAPVQVTPTVTCSPRC